MKLKTETYPDRQKALIAVNQPNYFTGLLKKKLQSLAVQVFLSPVIPENLEDFSICFFLNADIANLEEYANMKTTKIVFIFFYPTPDCKIYSQYIAEKKASHLKVIRLESYPHYFNQDIETILWFVFSRSEEIYLHIYHPKILQSKKRVDQIPLKQTLLELLRQYTNRHFLLRMTIIMVLIINFSFLPPLIAATFLNWQTVLAFQNNDLTRTKQLLVKTSGAINFAKKLYNISRPSLLLFSVASPTDNLFQINDSTYKIFTTLVKFQNTSRTAISLILLTDKTPLEKKKLKRHLEDIASELKTLESELLLLENKLPNWLSISNKLQLIITEARKGIAIVNKIYPDLVNLLSTDTQRTYLILFANNMELRPGGGFIGSFALLNLKDYTLTDLKVYDVYDADGQLKQPVSPPIPIAAYLQQPHWYLRDSAFSPDFYDNYQMARFFLEREINLSRLDGGILVTTTAVQNILASTDGIYLPDYQETITKNNFYLKTQIYAENNFFPGSLQKKSFLTNLINQLIIQLEIKSPLKFLKAIKKSLEEKQISIYVEDNNLQKKIDELYWSGRIINPRCASPNTPNCIVDYLFPYDANLGVNKANFFVTRPITLDITIDPAGIVRHKLTMNYHNASYGKVFPGGVYKNYAQILLPLDSIIEKLLINNQEITKFDQRNENYKIIGYFHELPPQEKHSVMVNYTLPRKIGKGRGIYQLIIQKQIGSSNSELKLTFNMPPNFHIVKKNFDTLAKENKIIYNSSIASDKIFIIEFLNE